MFRYLLCLFLNIDTRGNTYKGEFIVRGKTTEEIVQIGLIKCKYCKELVDITDLPKPKMRPL